MMPPSLLLRITGVFFMLIILIITATCTHSTSETNYRLLPQTQTSLRKAKETNMFNFLRLIVLRLFYGVASMFGFGEALANFGGGFLAPPSVDSDYGGLDYLGDDYTDDYDY